MSIQLVLSNYLSGLKERHELDALLPELLKAMGHSVLSRPQVGVGQGGVDVMSTCIAEDGTETVFLFIIKFGDVKRSDLYSGDQAIAPSVREACNDFVRNRIQAPLQNNPKHIVLVSNGELRQEAQSGFAALSSDVASRPLCSLHFWGTDQLTPLIERHLFDEVLLLSKGKSDLRTALAGLENSDMAIRSFARFVANCFDKPEDEVTASDSTRKKRFLKRCAAAAMGWAVLLVWGRNEKNEKPGVVTGEFLALYLWSEAVRNGFQEDDEFQRRLDNVLKIQTRVLLEYFAKSAQQLMNREAVLRHRPERILYADLIFEEMGRLATLLLLLQKFSEFSEYVPRVMQLTVHLVNAHTGCRLPVYDGQAIDVSLLISAWLGCAAWSQAEALTFDIVDRLGYALNRNQYLPVDTDLLDDAIALNITKTAKPRDFFKTSTLIPALGTIASLLDSDATMRLLNEDIQPALKGVTLERWYPQIALETMTGSKQSIYDVGISRAIAGFPSSTVEERVSSLRVVKDAASPADFKWHNNWQVLVALSARLHRHPLPTWYLAAKHQEGKKLEATAVHASSTIEEK
ncbi:MULTISPECIES: hypothetical protein [Herbaspirillum]|uniref:hypothetical protein n=1 Tax=Herbaspirillum TaxID=963 RepID=UPI0008639DFE|nr:MULTISPECIES: hypothetical protein [Herbaspirillum]AON53117.1 hypothetical protein Hsc_0813 [Herbaspirillum seropedicae]